MCPRNEVREVRALGNLGYDGPEAGIGLNRLEINQAARREIVQDHDGMPLAKKPFDQVRADKSRSAGYQYMPALLCLIAHRPSPWQAGRWAGNEKSSITNLQ